MKVFFLTTSKSSRTMCSGRCDRSLMREMFNKAVLTVRESRDGGEGFLIQSSRERERKEGFVPHEICKSPSSLICSVSFSSSLTESFYFCFSRF